MSNDNDSLLNQLQSKLKKGLNPTTTKTTFPDGSVQLSSISGTFTQKSDAKTFGFVVDEKPDLSIGIVKPWLLISSQDVPNDDSLIRKYGVTHILSLLPGFILQESVKTYVKKHLILDIFDEESFGLDARILSAAFEFILEARADNGVVLVHCNAGISRAPSIAIAYLIDQENLTFEAGWEIVKAARPSMRPNLGFVQQLKNLDHSTPPKEKVVLPTN